MLWVPICFQFLWDSVQNISHALRSLVLSSFSYIIWLVLFVMYSLIINLLDTLSSNLFSSDSYMPNNQISSIKLQYNSVTDKCVISYSVMTFHVHLSACFMYNTIFQFLSPRQYIPNRNHRSFPIIFKMLSFLPDYIFRNFLS